MLPWHRFDNITLQRSAQRQKGNCPVGRIQKVKEPGLMGTEILQKGQNKKTFVKKGEIRNVLLAGIKWNGCPKCIMNSSHPFNEMDVLHIPWKNILSNNFDEKCVRAQDGCPLKQWFLTYPNPPWNYIKFHRYYAGSLLKIINGDNVLWLTSKPAIIVERKVRYVGEKAHISSLVYNV